MKKLTISALVIFFAGLAFYGSTQFFIPKIETIIADVITSKARVYSSNKLVLEVLMDKLKLDIKQSNISLDALSIKDMNGELILKINGLFIDGNYLASSVGQVKIEVLDISLPALYEKRFQRAAIIDEVINKLTQNTVRVNDGLSQSFNIQSIKVDRLNFRIRNETGLIKVVSVSDVEVSHFQGSFSALYNRVIYQLEPQLPKEVAFFLEQHEIEQKYFFELIDNQVYQLKNQLRDKLAFYSFGE